MKKLSVKMDQPGPSTNGNLNILLKKYYYDIDQPTSFGSIQKLYKTIKRIDNTVKYEDIAQWLLKQKTYGVHRYYKHKFERNPIVSRTIDHIWNADLMEITNFRENDNIKYILIVIDNLSKYCWAEPLLNKNGPTVKKAFLKIFRLSQRKPMILATDAGKEFTFRELKHYFRWRNIKHFVVRDDSHAVIAERLIRTLKEKIQKYITFNKTNRFIDVFPDIINGYNKSVHSRSKFKPVDVNTDNERQVYRNLFKTRHPIEKSRISIGDKVRIALSREVFDKGYLPNYSKNIYTICKIYYTSPFHKYRVKDAKGVIVRGSFYEKELIKLKK